MAAASLLASLLIASLASSAQAAPVGLGTAGDSAVLAGSTITNTGPSVITGDAGLSPGTVVSGFPPGLVLGGTIHATDGVALQAKADLATAYGDAAGRSSTATISADLAGSTLTAGVYTSASSLGLTGDLTLDAQNDPNAVFVFQAGSTLTAGSGSRVLFIRGARPCNVFWQVGSSATIGSTSAFAGNILAMTSISLITGATLNGRALARNGGVTLDTNLITKATCALLAPPTAANTSATTTAGQPVTVPLNGADASGAPVTYEITSNPSNGTLGPIDQANGTVTYTPDAGYGGTDSFVYEVNSPNGASNGAIASILVSPAGVGPQPSPQGPPAAGPGAQGTPARSGAQAPALGQDVPLSVNGRPIRAGTSAELSGPARCVTTAFNASVTGRGIRQVKFYFDGKWRGTMNAKPGQTVFTLHTNPKGKSFGVHHITAKVRFIRTSATKTRTLRMVYQRCAKAAVSPQFTG